MIGMFKRGTRFVVERKKLKVAERHPKEMAFFSEGFCNEMDGFGRIQIQPRLLAVCYCTREIFYLRTQR